MFCLVCQVDQHHREYGNWCSRKWTFLDKNSSMELAVIWENFSCSDLACSDLAHSDLAHSDLAHSDLGCYFLSKFLLFSLNIHKVLGNSFSTHPKNKFDQVELSHIVSQQYPHINQKNCAVSIFIFSIKNDFLTQTLVPPENYIKIFKNIKMIATSQIPIQYINISSIYFFHKIFVPSEIWRHFYIHTPFFPHF